MRALLLALLFLPSLAYAQGAPIQSLSQFKESLCTDGESVRQKDPGPGWECYDATATGSMTSFDIDPDDAGNVTVTDGETIGLVGGDGILTSHSGDNLRIDVASDETDFMDDVSTLGCTTEHGAMGLVNGTGVLQYCGDEGSIDLHYVAIADDSAGKVDHGGLLGLSDDDHTQYLKLAGRAGGQTAIGGTASGNGITITANSAAENGTIALNAPDIDIFPSMVGNTLSADTSLINMDNDFAISAGGGSFRFVDFTADVTFDGTVPQVFVNHVGGTWDFSSLSVPVNTYTFTAYKTDWTLQSDDGWIRYMDSFFDTTTVSYTGTTDMTDSATNNNWAPISFVSRPIYQTTNSGDYNYNYVFGSLATSKWITSNASSTLSANNYSAYAAGGPWVPTGAGVTTLSQWAGLLVDWDLFVDTLKDSGSSVTDAYGILINSLAPSGSGTVGETWSLYSVDANAAFWHAGKASFGGVSDTPATHTLEVGSGQGDMSTSTNVITSGAPSYAVTGTGQHSWLMADGTITHGSVSALLGSWSAFRAAPTHSVTSTTSSNLSTGFLFWDDTTYTTSVDNGPNDAISFAATVDIAATADRNASTTTYEGIRIAPTVKANAAGVTFTVAELYGYIFNPTTTSVAGETTTVTDVYGNYTANMAETGAGTSTTTNMFGLYIESLTNATNSAGVFNSDATVYNPTADTITAAESISSKHKTAIRATAGAAVTTDTTTAITDGDFEGQILVIVNSDTTATDKVTIDNGANTNLGTDLALNPGGVGLFYWDGTLSQWTKIAANQNKGGQPCAILKTDTVGVSTDDGAEKTLHTYTIAASALATLGDYVEFEYAGTMLADTDDKTIRVKFGSTTILTVAETATTGDWRITGRCLRSGSATQECAVEYAGNGTITSTMDYTQPGETLTGTVVLQVTGDNASDTSASAVTAEYSIVRWCPAGAN